MKLLTNFDLIDAINDVNQPLGPMKVIRGNKVKYILDMPLFLSAGLIFQTDIEHTILAASIAYGLTFSTDWLIDYIATKALHSDKDIYADNAKKKLMILSSLLKEINVKTNYDMLLESELYQKKYKMQFNENKFPLLLEEKYILVPSYSFSGEVTDTSILQEHIKGSNRYALLVGESCKTYRRILVNNNA